MASHYPSHRDAVGTGPTRPRDITWGRILFQPPFLPNPRIIFDPLPFRTQLFSAPARRRKVR
ncbi:MAG TPA: hypothetical protein VEB66_15900 [Opitutaceae bacterium]|nr:hypothetical protein [Opitutaceae bacterium]